MATTYTAVVETGSCSTDYRRWETKATCGHAHRTIDAAEDCGNKLRGGHYNHGSFECSALWYNFTIHNQDGERIRS